MWYEISGPAPRISREASVRQSGWLDRHVALDDPGARDPQRVVRASRQARVAQRLLRRLQVPPGAAFAIRKYRTVAVSASTPSRSADTPRRSRRGRSREPLG